MAEKSVLFLPSDVAKSGRVTVQTVFGWEGRGLIAPTFRTPNGTRLFDPAEVKRFLAQRRKRLRKR